MCWLLAYMTQPAQQIFCCARAGMTISTIVACLTEKVFEHELRTLVLVFFMDCLALHIPHGSSRQLLGQEIVFMIAA